MALLPRVVLITGASSGLGAALARAYARDGVVLGLLGRDIGRLQEVVDICRTQGAVVTCAAIDVRDVQAMAEWIGGFDAAYPVELVIANAGISAGTGDAGEEEAQVRAIFDVNVTGVLNTVWPLIPPMCARGRGQVAIISSLAGVRALPSAPAYSASKAMVRVYGDALRGQLRRYGVGVSVVCPGFVDTPMTRVNPFPMPLLMAPGDAARRIVRALSCGKRHICFPRRLYYPLYFLSLLPVALTDRVFAWMPGKPHIS